MAAAVRSSTTLKSAVAIGMHIAPALIVTTSKKENIGILHDHPTLIPIAIASRDVTPASGQGYCQSDDQPNFDSINGFVCQVHSP
jgi:hypothetical protein